MGDQASLDAVAYAKVLLGRTEGYPFHSPQAEGVIGDCGVIRDGQFVFLFNCFVDGIGGERLPTSEPNPSRIPTASDLTTYPVVADRTERSVQVRDNQGVVWCAHQGRQWSAELEVPIPLLVAEVGFGFQASSASGKAAFLAPGNASRRVEKFNKDKVFSSYLARRHDDIRARFGSEFNTRTVCIIEGTTHAFSWCRGVATQHTTEIKGFVAINPMLPGIPGWRVGGSTGQSIKNPWSIESGPPLQPPNGELHLISARLAIKRSRLPDALRPTPSATMLAHDASAQSPSGHASGPASESSRPSNGLSTSTGAFGGSGGASSVAAYQLSGVLPHGPSYSVSYETAALLPNAPFITGDWDDRTPSHQRTDSEMDTASRNTSPSDTSSILQIDSPPNPIEVLLDAALAAHWQLDAIVAGWGVLEEFWTSLGDCDDCEVDNLIFDVEEFEYDDGRIARLRHISSRDAATRPQPASDGTQSQTARTTALMQYNSAAWDIYAPVSSRVIHPQAAGSSAPVMRSSLVPPSVVSSGPPVVPYISETIALHNFISHRGYTLDWIDEILSNSRGWKSTAFVDGYALGVGIGPRKNEARQAAAAHALHYLRTHPNALPSRRAGSSASSAVTH